MTAPSDYSDAIAAYRTASLAVWNDPAAWRAEACSDERRTMAWPRPEDQGTRFERLLAFLFNADVPVVLALLREQGDEHSPAWLPEIHDPKLQIVLRVVQRGCEAGAAAMVEAFGGERITGLREFKNEVHESMAAFALQAARDLKMTRDAAFEFVGLPRRKGFRAVKRTHRRK